MLSKASFYNFVTKIWGNRTFLILLLFNILTNAVAITVYNDVWSVLTIICISVFFATVESCFCRLFRSSKVRNILMWVLVAFHVLFAIVDVFLAVNFRQIFTIDSIGIIAETTPKEIDSFFTTYLSVENLILFIVGAISIIWFVVRLARKLIGNRVIALASMVLSLIGLLLYGQMACSHVIKGEGGMSLSQLHSFTRMGYSLVSFNKSIQFIEHLRLVNQEITAAKKSDCVPVVVVIIGESFSRYHSSLYGYSKQTNPRLSEWVKEGSLLLYDDVVSPHDHTGNVVTAVLTVNGSDEPYCNEVLFPTLFRKAGFKTVLVDNQYFAGKAVSRLTDKKLSDIMFDYRNTDEVGFDENLITEIPDLAEPQLILIHLFGQHYIYANRYPSDFKRFSEADYSKNLSQSEREEIAHYDNATLYNDYVVDKVIRKYQDKNCIVVYFSDHGEELFEIDDFMGHGNAISRPTLKYQIRVPMMIWTSKAFQSQYPDIVSRLAESRQKPITTAFMSHFLLEVAGVETKYYCPERSFINDKYDVSNSRYILGGLTGAPIDFDTIRENVTFKPRY